MWIVAVVAAVGVAAAGPASAAPGDRHRVRAALDTLVGRNGLPGGEAVWSGRHGPVRTVTAGVGDVVTGRPYPAGGSVTNYLMAGVLVERVTGRPWYEEVDRRIVRPLGLRDTYLPADHEHTLRGPHPRLYLPWNGDRFFDVTETDVSWAPAAGGLVSSGADVTRFLTTLLGGRLLPPAQLAEMRRTVPVPTRPGVEYGLGIYRFPLPAGCGGVSYWGHLGGTFGSTSVSGATDDGRAAMVANNYFPVEPRDDQFAVMRAALC